MSNIEIMKAREGNLKNISVTIPKNKLVVFTGVSGSGKSTLLMDVLFDECQRQYLEALSMQGIRKPKVERIQGASPAIFISQVDVSSNPRSTVGTMSDIYTDLRMVYEKLGICKCPHCGEMISPLDCKEETEKINNDFYVYMYCCKCNERMDKITRTHFSFNTKAGACPTCEGLGKIHSIKVEKMVDESLTLEEGAVRYWETQYGNYQISILYAAFKHYGITVPKKIPVQQFSELQKEVLYKGIECELLKQEYPDCKPPKSAAMGKYEGAIPILWRRFKEKEGNAKQLEACFDILECTECKGERLCESSRAVSVNGIRLPQLTRFSLERLCEWNEELIGSIPKQRLGIVRDYLLDMKTKITRFIKVGIGYLTIDRQVITLSGGELQRLRLAAILDSDLSGIIYILDEPTAGLHPKDTAGLILILKKLRDLGNSVLVIEHDMDIMREADYMIDIGPQSGKHGGEIVAIGNLEEIKKSSLSMTGKFLEVPLKGKTKFRKETGKISIQNANTFNLKNISVDIPLGCLVAVTGPSGSGKSTLIFEELAKKEKYAEGKKIVTIEQSPITKMKRSNVATFTEVYVEIRKVFAKLEVAKKAGLTAKHFSFNTTGGRCENCEGLGYVDNNMLFFTNTQVICPVCNGNQFKKEVLAIKCDGLSIKEVLNLSIEEGVEFFRNQPKIRYSLKILLEVGLGYLELGQTLTTLSGGEGQRLKLAKELLGCNQENNVLYLMDEPTTGLHPQDIEHFLVLLNKIVDAGNSIVVVEHNSQLISNSDWVIDLGLGGGDKGGQVIYEGHFREEWFSLSNSVR